MTSKTRKVVKIATVVIGTIAAGITIQKLTWMRIEANTEKAVQEEIERGEAVLDGARRELE